MRLDFQVILRYFPRLSGKIADVGEIFTRIVIVLEIHPTVITELTVDAHCYFFIFDKTLTTELTLTLRSAYYKAVSYAVRFLSFRF